MRYIAENREALTKQFHALKARFTEHTKLNIYHHSSDFSQLWKILHEGLESILNSTKFFVKPPLVEITVYPEKKQFSFKFNRVNSCMFKGYIANKSDYKNRIAELDQALREYGLKIQEREDSIKRNSKKNIIIHTHEYEVIFENEV